MPNTTSFEFGDVVLVPFPFTDQTTAKKRPAVVVSSRDYQRERPDIILIAVSSQRYATGSFDTVLDHWQHAGLIRPSVLKPLLATIERGLILRKLGELHSEDQEHLGGLLGRMLGG